MNKFNFILLLYLSNSCAATCYLAAANASAIGVVIAAVACAIDICVTIGRAVCTYRSECDVAEFYQLRCLVSLHVFPPIQLIDYSLVSIRLIRI
jgi:hypothetical protein